jgi:predicted dehydrogenase
MTILICGLGSIGRRHLQNLQALGYKNVVLLRSGKSTLADDDLIDLPVEWDLARALDRWRPEAVIVANPTSLHMGVAIPAAESGSHLFIEKPVSHNLEKIEELRTAVTEGGGQVLMGFQFRFNPGLQAVKRMLEEHVIGRPISVRAHWGEYLPDWHPWEDYRTSYSARADLGGGVVLTLCHPFDYLRWLLGEVDGVRAEFGERSGLGLEVEDTAEIIMTFVDGPLISVHLDYNQRPPRHDLEIIGSEGTIRWDSKDSDVHFWTVEKQGWSCLPAPEGFTRNDMFLAEMRHFLQVISGKAAPLCTLEDGIRALKIALAVHKSGAEGGLVKP